MAATILSNLFWSRVNKNGPTPEHQPDLGPCWIWTGVRTKHGYGYLKFCGKTLTAHRLAYEFENGPLEDGSFACHRCDNPSCCNPDHLFSGRALENNQDASTKGRYINRPAPNRPKGEQQRFAKLNNDQVLQIRRLYEDGGTSYPRLAKQFNVSITLIAMIIRREAWKHL